jgi:hypothetical protein
VVGQDFDSFVPSFDPVGGVDSHLGKGVFGQTDTSVYAVIQELGAEGGLVHFDEMPT